MGSLNFKRLAEEYRKGDYTYSYEEALLELGLAISEAMEAQGVNRSELARRVGKEKSYITRLLNGPKNVTLKSIVQLAHALGRDLSIEFREAVQEEAHVDVEEAAVVTATVSLPRASRSDERWANVITFVPRARQKKRKEDDSAFATSA